MKDTQTRTPDTNTILQEKPNGVFLVDSNALVRFGKPAEEYILRDCFEKAIAGGDRMKASSYVPESNMSYSVVVLPIEEAG